VDVNDLAILANNYNTPSGADWATADFDGNGAVDVRDLALLANHYGFGTAAGGGAALPDGYDVPEPAGAALVLLGLPSLLRRRRRRALA
jgi:hypothetical protein